MPPLVVILLGAPGAGKGTQAQSLRAASALPHISTGDLFREGLKQGTQLGLQAKGYMDRGQLVPDGLVLDMLFDRVSRPDCGDGYLLDGFPRTLAQARAFEDRLEPDAIVVAADLQVPDDVIIERAAGRLVCKTCGHIQHLKSAPPRVAGRCDKCGGALERRKDDDPAVVRQRLLVYHGETAPLVDFYADRGVLKRIDGNRPPEAVFADLLRLLPEAPEEPRKRVS